MAKTTKLSAGANAFIVVIIITGIWCSASAGAADWRPYAGDQHFSYFYDARRIDYPYKTVSNVLNLELSKLNIISVWTKRLIRDEKAREWLIQEQRRRGFETKGYEHYEYNVAKKELDCLQKKYRVLSEADYGKDGGALRLLINDARYADWKPIPPDSDTEALRHAICENAKERKSGQRDFQQETR